MDARVPLGKPRHTGSGAIVGVVLGDNDFPVERTLLAGQGLELALDPWHTVPDRHHHADERAVARLLLVRHPDAVHDRC